MTSQRHSHQGLPDFHLPEGSGNLGRTCLIRAARLVALAIALLLILGLGRSFFVRWANAKTLASRAAASAVLHVQVVEPGHDKHANRLTLPATLQGIVEAQIYARANGYVRRWFKDIGQPVKKGEVLAILDIPEVDKQVEEARANFALAKTAFERWSKLRERDAVSQQEYDEKAATYQQTQAVLKRLEEQQGFGKVVAPFDGIVTRRSVDIGALVNAGNGGLAQALFATAQIDTLRVYVYVPQDRANRVKVGDSVDILRPESSGKPVKGRIVRTAGAIDPVSRTLQIEIQVANADHALLPGAYVDVALGLQTDGGLTLPTTTLLSSADGIRVALAQPDGTVRLRRVDIGTDYGKEVEIKSGIAAGDKVIINPPDSIADGQKIAVATGKQAG